MNSLFSSFDVLCAEILSGKNLKTSFASSSSSSSFSTAMNNKAMEITTAIGKQDQGSSGSQPSDRTQKKIGSSPRLAVEFDGLHCFETFVFH
ncbi:Avr9/Cf-9 rapidly elicited protein [Parasponia andersonii]|uniref:Avr9/Cf-9 rapidly elicited protein n=1 Tax=Parasponia andersonii TaxID=3476 RepID=A0A2P5DJN8_PARAD|nr:Avr9/Cf-9 rapidly elicited protein [Parasponia andersonii]